MVARQDVVQNTTCAIPRRIAVGCPCELRTLLFTEGFAHTRKLATSSTKALRHRHKPFVVKHRLMYRHKLVFPEITLSTLFEIAVAPLGSRSVDKIGLRLDALPESVKLVIPRAASFNVRARPCNNVACLSYGLLGLYFKRAQPQQRGGVLSISNSTELWVVSVVRLCL